MTISTQTVAANVQNLRERIARAAQSAGRSSEEITLVAVSKTFPAEAIRAAYEAGLRHFGENRVQEWESKRDQLRDLSASWHFIGHLQNNKARRAASLFDRVDSVDDLALAKKLDAVAREESKRLPVLIEVHLGAEATKSGVDESGLHSLAEGILSLLNLDLRGLMTVPPFFDETEQVRPFFTRLRDLRDSLATSLQHPLPALSMGMSHDFEIAIAEGATEVRIGTALFGGRPTPI
jgi:pyridoxal phosphate enzyme (YggS family)